MDRAGNEVERPGVPRESVPEPLARVAGHQQPTVEVLMPPGRGGLPAVFGTAVPPRGVSGVLRRLGYRIPEHKATRWQLLLLADRVDAWGWRLLPAAVAALAVAGGWVLRRRVDWRRVGWRRVGRLRGGWRRAVSRWRR